MSNVVNLNRFRKDKARQQRKATADENAAKFGQTKGEKTKNQTQLDKAKRDLDGHKLDRDTD
jgi:hypothetical protein